MEIRTKEFQFESAFLEKIALSLVWRRIWFPTLCLFLAGIVLVFGALAQDAVAKGLVGITAMCIAIALPLRVRHGLKQAFMSGTPGRRMRPMSLSISDSSIEEWQDGGCIETFSWEAIAACQRVDETAILQTADQRYVFIPKRAFSSVGDADAFETMVNDRLPLRRSRMDVGRGPN